MAEYYLISQLPSLDAISDTVPMPITEERFEELCHSFLSKKAQGEIDRLTLTPPRQAEKSGSALVEAWNEGERRLRTALGKVRAEKMHKAFEVKSTDLSAALLQVAQEAVAMDSPLEAERFLNRYRLEALEALRPMDGFSEEFVFYYGLKLKLLWQLRRFDAEQGRAAYKKIYHDIMNKDSLEAVQ
ncbi:MAG: hypothetical protein IJ168_00645 [Eubacterium sp.]|nr:hypothetical protein [Eubacterium sp.]